MNKKSIIFVIVTLVIFAGALFFVPTNMVSHINKSGNATNLSNKYSNFLLFSCVDILGSLLWNKIIDIFPIFQLMTNIKLKEGIKAYFSFLMLLVLFSMLFTTFSIFSSSNWLLIGGNLTYIIYLLDVTFRKKNDINMP